MFRQLERSENVARLVETGFRIALTRSAAAEDEWASIVTTAGVRNAFAAKHERFDQATVVNFLLRDRANPSSVLTAIEMARTNARAVRTALTQEAWEATNECWMALKEALARAGERAGSAGCACAHSSAKRPGARRRRGNHVA